MRVKKYLPSIITLSNLFLGFLSILYIQKGEFAFACHLILIAALLDSFDGKLARKIGVVSSFGKEIDSLADVVSFCLSPSFLVFNILFYSNISSRKNKIHNFPCVITTILQKQIIILF